MSEKSAVAPKKERTFIYTVARVLAWLIAHTIFPMRVIGKDRINALEAPYVLISNHNSWFDPVALAHAVKKYEVRFIAKKELMASKLGNYFLGKLHTIPVDRHQSDMMAMRSAVKVLKEGHILGIFPEGTRHKEGVMQDIEGGVAILALRGNVPILPVYLDRKMSLFRMTRIIVGEPMDISDLVEKGIDKTVCDALLERIRERYACFEAEYAKKQK